MSRFRFPARCLARICLPGVLLLVANCTWSSLYLDQASLRTVQPALPVFVNTDLTPKLTLHGGACYLPQSSFPLDGPNPAGHDANVSLQLPKWSWSLGADQYLLRCFLAGFSATHDAQNGSFESSQFRFGFRTRADDAFLQLNVFYSRQKVVQQTSWHLAQTRTEYHGLTSVDKTETTPLQSTGDHQASQFGVQATFNSGREHFRCIPGLSVYSDIGTLSSRDTLDNSLAINLVQFGIRPALSIRLIDGLYLSTSFDNDWYCAIKSVIWNRLYYHWRVGTELAVDFKGL